MATPKLSHFLRSLTRGMAAGALGDQSDRELVAHFLARQDEAVFETFVRRHGPMVYRVCWRILQHSQDAEDAFQATFLLLAQKLRTVRNRDSLASWLHGVAQRVALKAKAQAATRSRHEEQASMSATVPPDDVTWRELRMVLDAELARLPEKWRLPLILCYLEGRTQDEAAGQLGWSKSTFVRRLDDARAALGRRLTRKGVVWPAALSAVLLSDCVSPAALPSGLIGSIAEAAAYVAAGKTATAGLISAKVATLIEGVGKAMLFTKLKIATVVLLAVSVVITGAAALNVPVLAARQRAAESGTPQKPGSKDADKVKDRGAAGAPDLTKVDRTIKKEPAYQGKPKYCLLVFGPKAKDRVWLVLDGDTLYVDRNGNSDLTEEDKRIQAPAFRKIDYPAWARERTIEVGDISVGGLTHSGLVLSQQEYRRKVDPSASRKDLIPPAGTVEEWQEHVDKLWRLAPDGVAYELCIRLDPKCYGLFGDTKDQRVKHLAFYDRQYRRLVFADRPQDAPVVHFGGPLTLDLRPGGKFRRGEDSEKVSFRLGTLGHGPGTFALMNLGLVPEDVHPVVEIRFPAKKPGQKEVTRKYVLERDTANAQFCCPALVPDEAGLGMAKVTVTFPDWKEGRVAPATVDIPVVDGKPKKDTKP